MISNLDEQLRPFGICSPIRYVLHVKLVKLKLVNGSSGMPAKKIQLRIAALEDEKKLDVLSENKMDTGATGRDKRQEGPEYYSIDKDIQFNLSYGVTKISIRGFHPRRLGGGTLAFYNDLSLKRLFETDNVSNYPYILI